MARSCPVHFIFSWEGAWETSLERSRLTSDSCSLIRFQDICVNIFNLVQLYSGQALGTVLLLPNIFHPRMSEATVFTYLHVEGGLRCWDSWVVLGGLHHLHSPVHHTPTITACWLGVCFCFFVGWVRAWGAVNLFYILTVSNLRRRMPQSTYSRHFRATFDTVQVKQLQIWANINPYFFSIENQVKSVVVLSRNRNLWADIYRQNRGIKMSRCDSFDLLRSANTRCPVSQSHITCFICSAQPLNTKQVVVQKERKQLIGFPVAIATVFHCG